MSAFPAACAEDDEPESKPHEKGEHDKPAKPAPLLDPIVPTAASFSAVWGSAPDDVWACGSEGTIVHYDGKEMTLVPSNTDVRLLAVHGTAPDDVWFVGEMGTTLHWDGSTMTEVSHVADSTLLGVWANGREDVWTIGFYPQDRIGLVRHWTGGDVWDELLVGPAQSLWEIWSSGPGDIWVVGTNIDLTGLVLHAQGEDVSVLQFDGDPLRGVWGTSADDVWVLPYETPIQHWDGSEFETSDSSLDNAMLGMWGAESDDVWAVGLQGTILHYDGSDWQRSETGITDTLWSVYGFSKDDVWAAGGEGTLLRWHGESWKKLQVGVPVPSELGDTN